MQPVAPNGKTLRPAFEHLPPLFGGQIPEFSEVQEGPCNLCVALFRFPMVRPVEPTVTRSLHFWVGQCGCTLAGVLHLSECGSIILETPQSPFGCMATRIRIIRGGFFSSRCFTASGVGVIGPAFATGGAAGTVPPSSRAWERP